jgi:hypothetical protein
MLELVLSAMSRSVPPARRLVTACAAAGYHSRAKGCPVARKWPTLMHWVAPIWTRLAWGWCTWPNRLYRGWVSLMTASSCSLPRYTRLATVSYSSSGTSGGMCEHSTSTWPMAASLAAKTSSSISFGVR